EQMVDKAARELGLDPVAVRRMNFIREFPHFIPTGNVYDSGDYERVLDYALELADYGRWRDEQRRLREQEGRYIGIGVIAAQERSVFSGGDHADADVPALLLAQPPLLVDRKSTRLDSSH